MKRIFCIITAAFGIILAVFGSAFVFRLFGVSSGTSVGIIGGADGPTAIFIASKSEALPYIMTGCAVLCITLIVIALVLMLRKRK